VRSKLDPLSLLRTGLRTLQAGVNWFFRSPWLSAVILFVLSLAVRLDQLAPLPSWAVPNENPQREIGRIALSVVQTGEFADPYAIPTGPTAHVPPIYPYLLGWIYRAFGLTRTAGVVSFLLVAVIASVLYGLLPWISMRLGLGSAAGFIGGLIGAVQFEVPWLHSEDLAALALLGLLAAFVVRWKSRRVHCLDSLLLGIGIGVSFHVQPALLPVMVGCMAFELWWLRSQRRWMFVSLMALGALLVCVPWAWRNYTTFHELFFVRSNLGLELRMGNNPNSEATFETMDAYQSYLHPTLLESEAQAVIQLGEVAYMRRAGQQALDWIVAHPGRFLELTAQRFLSLWFGPLNRPLAAAGVTLLTGLAVCGALLMFPRLGVFQRAAMGIPLLAYPLIYYIVAYMPGYRAPIDWILYILAGAAISRIAGLTLDKLAGSYAGLENGK
jgi:hypothetical protein